MHDVFLIFPHQLYPEHPKFRKDIPVVLAEDPLFFGDLRYPATFHKQKLMLHRASMKQYQDELRQKGYTVYYKDYQALKDPDALFRWLYVEAVEHVHVFDPTDFVLEKRIRQYAAGFRLALTWYDSPNFLTSKDHIEVFFENKKKYFMAEFYMWQRKRLRILVDDDGKPAGGKWSFDTENRKRLPKDISVPELAVQSENPYVAEAKRYVQRHFKQNPGLTEPFIYPINHSEAKQWFEHFLATRFSAFGPYEDAIAEDHPFLFHSVLTPVLNIGLLNPEYVVQRTLAYAKEHEIPLPSLEGFIRQVIGWREFIRAVYVRDGVRQRTSNFLNHQRRLTDAWYNGTTGIPPVDDLIQQLNRYAYGHHIQRLMVLGNLMLLCEIDPDDVYRWFMEMFIDSYDWVMVPNVYSMSQFAEGGLMTTKPYFSSSNYILKMSDYQKEPWCDIWDGLFWRFVQNHTGLLSSNPRMGVIVKQLETMDPDRKVRILKEADLFIQRVTTL